MRRVKRALTVLAVLLLLIIAVGLLFFPAKIEVSRNVFIARSTSEVFDYVNDMSKFNEWSPWYEKDTAAEYIMEGPVSGIGATMKWISDHEDVGSGSFTTVEAKKPVLIRRQALFMENGEAVIEYRFGNADGGTRMSWTLIADAGANPFMRILGTMIKERVGADFDRGLNNLKQVLEVPIAMNKELLVERAQLDVMYYLFVKAKCSEKDLGKVLAEGYAKVSKEADKQSIPVVGAPFAIYLTPPPELDVEIALPTGKPGSTRGDVFAGERRPGKALLVRHFGPYDRTFLAHEAVDRYVKDNQLKVAGPPWESYVTDPSMEKDTSLWETDIYYPIY